MKRVTSLLWVLTLIYGLCFGEVMNDPKSISSAIDSIKKACPAGMSDFPKMRETPEYKSLEASLPSVWMTAMDNLEIVAPTMEDQQILFESFEGLKPTEYLEFLNRALDLYDQGKVDLGAFMNGVFFTGGKMQFFISHNYDQPEVAAFLEKAEEVLKKKGEPFMFNVQEARSGKLKKLHDAARANHPELAKQPIPLLRPAVLPSPTADSTATKPPPMATSDHSPKSETPSSPTVQVELPKSTPWAWIVGVILLLAVAGGLLFKPRRR